MAVRCFSPAGEIGRAALEQVPDLQHAGDLLRLPPRMRILGRAGKQDVFQHAHMRKAGRGLKDHRQPALLRRLLADLLAPQDDPSLRTWLQAGDHFQQCALAAAARSKQHMQLSLFQRQAARVERSVLSIAAAQPHTFQNLHDIPLFSSLY